VKRRAGSDNAKLLKRPTLLAPRWHAKDTKSNKKCHNDGSKMVPSNKMAVRSQNRDTRSRKQKWLDAQRGN
jgi:hypothetical protein